MRLKANDLGVCGTVQAFSAGIVKFNTEGIDEGVKICDIPKGLIIVKAVAKIKKAFNASTTNVLTVGFEENKNELLGDSDVTESSVGIQTKDIWIEAGNHTEIFAKFIQTGDAATDGEAEIFLVVIPTPVG